MSKIICDVCGTAYPENAVQCPICGSAKTADARIVSGNRPAADGQEKSSYQYVKGGRFSKKNVRKRNQEMARMNQQPSGQDGEEEKSNRGLIILMFVLLAAVIALVIYILLRWVPTFFVQPTDPTDPPVNPSAGATTDPTEPSQTEEPTVPCQGLSMQETRIELDAPGATAALRLNISPANTTDMVSYETSDEAVATVDSRGNVTAIGEGSAVITATCGQFRVSCEVRVTYATQPPTDPPTEPPTEPPTDPVIEIELNRDDITFFYKGESWKLYSGNLPLNQITWSSDDETVAKFENGTVTAVGPGRTKVHAEINGVKVSCIIRCNWESDDPTDPPPSVDPNETYTISKNDVTIAVGESFYLTLKDSYGNIMDVDWVASESGYVKIEGNKITGLKEINSSSFKVYVKIGDTTYSCIVRVR